MEFRIRATSFDVMPDGRFVWARYDIANRTPGISVVLHWFEQLRSAGPAATSP